MRFKFDHKTKKIDCPACGHHRTFRTYIDTETNEPLHPSVGMCDRINNCAHHYRPGQYFNDTGKRPEAQTEARYIPPPPPRRSDWRAPQEWVTWTKQSHAKNKFAHWLAASVGREKAKAAFEMYRVGTLPLHTGYEQYEGACVYWQAGLDQQERSGKIMQYLPSGKRVPEMNSYWMHKLITGKDLEEIGCAQTLFGEHLLRDRPKDPVCVVESEKSAMICSCFWPQYVWVATGGESNMTVERMMPLVGGSVHVFPDKGVYSDYTDKQGNIRAGWRTKTYDVEVMCERLVIYDLLEHMEEVPKGADIADLLLPVNRLENIRIFEPEEVKEEAPPEPVAEPVQASSMPPVLTRMIAYNPAVQTLLDVLDVDTENITIKPLHQ